MSPLVHQASSPECDENGTSHPDNSCSGNGTSPYPCPRQSPDLPWRAATFHLQEETTSMCGWPHQDNWASRDQAPVSGSTAICLGDRANVRGQEWVRLQGMELMAALGRESI